ncbi:MAG: hypothetical protein A3D44_03455 [Candidatus Staskawiczbacteria bacterium RIFCSPHIGHO2_02_FULL_42_22]|uniref:Uncharacterized protein n=1 Tax=Candidatus Staskawiczbacteria bacterium RIFCSPHIGHO2_02_FULL_42_22 TaxID=1802207 RepID=A0A1G2I3V7_9BACT|nr:MAG: hypothetical protein A3D44_03455 [Candidatus Staskawiczbacteria bacterium RIFCSPHIGHO2_02_FULL_42_22]
MDQKNNQEEITTIPELAKMINSSFQAAQEHVDEKFAKIDEKFTKVDERFNTIEKKLDGFIEKYDEAKLPMRVDYIENILNLPKK